MAKRQVFYSFHFDNDVMRVQQIRNMGIVEGDQPVAANEWEQLQRRTGGVEKWIDDNMRYRSCVIVLIGEDTYRRPWVKYEIEKAWKEKKGLFWYLYSQFKGSQKWYLQARGKSFCTNNFQEQRRYCSQHCCL